MPLALPLANAGERTRRKTTCGDIVGHSQA
jgi:hypothetical protein